MDPLTLPPRDWILIHVNSSHIQRKEHPTMASIRRIVTQWGRRIAGGLILALLFSQMALAMYACPKLDADTHAASMQMAGMAMDEATGMSAMPDSRCVRSGQAASDGARRSLNAHLRCLPGGSRPQGRRAASKSLSMRRDRLSLRQGRACR